MINSFVRRLSKIGITVDLVGNYPWIYLEAVNEKKVSGAFRSKDKFTAFFLNKEMKFSDRREVFKKIRETLNESN